MEAMIKTHERSARLATLFVQRMRREGMTLEVVPTQKKFCFETVAPRRSISFCGVVGVFDVWLLENPREVGPRTLHYREDLTDSEVIDKCFNWFRKQVGVY